jgi:Tol biopolymer transport system component
MGPDGENARKLYDTDENSEITAVTWSPDGQRIGYVKSSQGEDVAYSRDLKGGPPVISASASDLNSTPGELTLPDSRALYSRLEPGAPEDTCNFWIAKVDPRTMKPIEQLQRLTNWTGFCMDPTSATRDGKRIAFLKWTSHRTIYMADLDAHQIRKSRHFTIDETGNTPIDWTPDGKYVVFWSIRNGTVTLMKQRSDGDDEETIVSVNGSFAEPVVSADGNWILWQSEGPNGAANSWKQVMRVSISGGAPEAVDRVRSGAQLQCARYPSSLCILAEPTEDGKHAIVTKFDPLRGRGAQLVEFDIEAANKLNGTLSYDGCCLALMPALGAPIRVISLRGQPEHQTPTPGLNAKQFIRWTANGNGFYVTNGIKGGMDLFVLDMVGHSKQLWHNDGDFAPIAMGSPDMRHLAIQGSSLEENLWLMENP